MWCDRNVKIRRLWHRTAPGSGELRQGMVSTESGIAEGGQNGFQAKEPPVLRVKRRTTMNRFCVLILVLLACPRGPLLADEARAMVRRSLPFLEKEGVAWMTERNCASCHQVPAMLWSLDAAARAGLEVDPQKLVKWWAWSVDWKSWVDPKRNAAEAKVVADNVDTMARLLLGRSPAAKDAPWVPTFRDHLVGLQGTNGAWKAQGQLPSGRRPARETQEVTTLCVLLALKSAEAPGAPLTKVYQLASDWVAKGQPGKSTEWWALRLLLAKELGTPAQVTEGRNALLGQQNADGGWGWLVGEASDAFGTGLALHALGRTGLTTANPALQKAVEFLKTTQEANGSWAVPSTRAQDSKRVRETSRYWGTAWAVQGILETLPPGGSDRAKTGP